MLKLKDMLRELGGMWPPQKGTTEAKVGRREIQPEQLCAATIVNAVETRRRCGVLLTVSHPEYPEGHVHATIIAPDGLSRSNLLATNLAEAALGFVGKTVEQLGEADVTADLQLAG